MKKQIASILVTSSLLLSGCASDWCTSTKKPCAMRQKATTHVAIPTSALFGFDSAALTHADNSAMKPLAVKLAEKSDLSVKVQGHTDSTGPSAYNLKLSQERAQSVASYLEQHGVNADRIVTEGFGEDKPVASNETVAGRAQNRRVEIKIYK